MNKPTCQSIVTLENSNQTARLEATYKPDAQLHDKVFRYELMGDNPQSWELTYEQCQEIYARDEISVLPDSRERSCGTFNIGQYRNWLYTKNLHQDPHQLKNEIRQLMGVALRGQ